MNKRVYNFYPGPATLPLPVLELAGRELLNYAGSGMSVMEMSHRSKQIESLVHETESRLLDLLGAGKDYRALFLQGGASLQFAMVPYNLLAEGGSADYIVTGSFAEKAWEEAKRVGRARLAASTAGDNYSRLPKPEEINLDPGASYVHITTNNTIYGTQWHWYPETGNVPLVADMSSDILSRPLEVSRFALIYAGAQKNLGPSGVTVVIIRKELLEKSPGHLPVILRYDTHAKNDSLYNTPSTFGIYIINLVLKWIEGCGGLKALSEQNSTKASLIYDAIDDSGGFYRGHAAADCRSLMNITFRLPGAELEEKFLSEAERLSLVGLKGHRSVGGIRASIYNAMSREGCEALAGFMHDFRRRNG